MRRPTTKRKKRVGAIAGTKRKTGTRRRRKMAGITDGMTDKVMKAFALGGGALLGRELNAAVVAADPTLSPTVSGLVQAAIGFIVPMLLPNEEIVDFIGYGMTAQGLMVTAVSQIGVLQGINGPRRRMSYVYRRAGMNGANFNTIAGRRGFNGANFNTIAGPSTSTIVMNGRVRRKSLVH